MWNCPDKPIPEHQIVIEHMRVLYEGIQDAHEGSVKSKPLYEALDYLCDKVVKRWGIALYREGLEKKQIEGMIKGLYYIKRDLGLADEKL